MSFKTEYLKLNDLQRGAVDTIEGPMLVIAGPGTGKTQLLSLRVANIIAQTDISPANILCLTFTDNAARNMRERLESIIGQAAYHVSIHTFHGFGVEIINQYSDYFSDRNLLQQIDELGSYELLSNIFETLPHDNPLSVKVGNQYILLRDTQITIGWLKQNGLTPREFQTILDANSVVMEKLNSSISKTFNQTISSTRLKNYQQLLSSIEAMAKKDHPYGFPDYATVCASELSAAIENTDPTGRYAPKITQWRNKWCQKNYQGQHVFKDSGKNTQKLKAISEIYEKLLENMRSQGLYDFDDMIMEAVHRLEDDDELRLNLQERYQYILVDEFQDTNKAQLRLLQAIGDNPIFEKRPNIMVVGDDDQAIYAFQGAEVSNMVAFANSYLRPNIITLKDNYRSTQTILDASYAVANQITDRLESVLPDSHKQLQAQTLNRNGELKHYVLPSELSQYQWIAEQVKLSITKGLQPESIAIIAPRHRYLERLVPYLAEQKLPVSYERRENILEAPIIRQLLTMANLLVAIAEGNHQQADMLLSEVISYELWGISSEVILQISISCYEKHTHWLPVLIKHKQKQIRELSNWFISLSRQISTEPLEYILDSLVGDLPEGNDSDQDERSPFPKKSKFVSPMREYYFSNESYEYSTDTYLALLGQLSSLRQRLRQWKPNQTLYTTDLVNFAKLHTEAHLKIIDTNPHTQTTNAVQVMTAYKAKGLEFDQVFVINAQDEIWGPTSRSRSIRIKLPQNLPLAPASDQDNDKLRLLYVSMTRAKNSLIITSYSHTLENRLSPGLSFILDNEARDTETNSGLKPITVDRPANTKSIEILTTDWAYRFRNIIADKPTLFEPILANYKLSVTHLNNFIDIIDAGPNYFFTHNLLRFPQAITAPAAYGDAVHKTLQWSYDLLKSKGKLPKINGVQDYFVDMLNRKQLRQREFERLTNRGKEALAIYINNKQANFDERDLIERGFNNEGVIVNGARLSGKIDKIHFISPGVAEVVDFKTGKPADSWKGKDEYEKVKLHKYKQQLFFYKLLIEQAASFRGKTKVSAGALEFIETDDQNRLLNNLEVSFDDTEINHFKLLIGSIWQHIQALNFPDTSKYPKNIKGVLEFEEDLISKFVAKT